jgi:hypothetical protein
MKTIETTTMDKSEWGPGPWQSEPDRVQFEDPDTGLPCLIIRSHLGALCGYVGIPESHPLFGVSYTDIENISVHGGLTFSDNIEQDVETEKLWWLGFHCAHIYDLIPYQAPTMRKHGLHDFGHKGIYRDINYVKYQIADLAKQLKI